MAYMEIEYTEIYATYDEIHADLIRQLLEGKGIPCLLRSMKVGGYQGITFGPLGELRVRVPKPYAQKGKRLIQDAINDGVLWPLGSPIEG